jgi:hypothetical protein
MRARLRSLPIWISLLVSFASAWAFSPLRLRRCQYVSFRLSAERGGLLNEVHIRRMGLEAYSVSSTAVAAWILATSCLVLPCFSDSPVDCQRRCDEVINVKEVL